MKAIQAVFITLLPLAAATAAWAMINPNFTPIHLAEGSETILIVKGKGKDVPDKFELETVKALKGKAPAATTIDVTAAPKQHADAIREALKGAADQPMLLLVGKYEKEQTGFLHAGGAWWQLSGGGGGQWKFAAKNGEMQGTWAGGTDMLIRCLEYILAEGADASVPVKSGTGWRGEPKLVATLKAAKPTARNISAVDLAGDNKLCLHVALPEGDRLLRPMAGKEEFEDITEKTGLKAKSQAGCWGDFNEDGRLDLLSFDGKSLWLWRQNTDGTFAPVKAGGSFAIPEDCPGLETMALFGGTAPAVVVSGSAPALILKPSGKDAFAAVTLPQSESPPADAGKMQASLAADFNNDGLPDVLVPYEKNGLLYAARKGGGFELPRACNVHCTAGGGMAVAGDFDGDGWLDVLAAGTEGVRIFQNLHDGTFEESLAASGEVSYKGQPFASWCGVCDFNNDSRLDLLLTYSTQPGLLYFNRGFRSFGQAPDLELKLGEGIPDFDKGQQMGLFADFDGDGAQDYALLMPGGKLYVAYNDFGEDARCLSVALPKAAPGPVNVSLWAGKRLLGVRPARFGSPAFWGIPSAGKYTLKWTYPGGAEQVKALAVEKPLTVVLDSAGGK